MPKRIIITGATGFIGAAIAREFLMSGHEVIVLTRANSNLSRLDNLKHSLQFVIYENLVEKTFIKSMMVNSLDVLVHCAWRGVAGVERNEPFQIYENIPATIQSVELAAKLGCHQWIGLGSQAEYGNLNCKISENSETLPTTLYGKAKLSAGIAALGLCEAYEIKGSWLRVFSIYGPGDAVNWFIPFVIQEFLAGRAPKLTKCEQLWDYLHVEDAARAVIAVAQAKVSGIFNLGSGSTHPLRAYIETIREILRTDLIPEYGAIAYRPDQVMHLEADISKLIKQTGWKPSMNLLNGLTQTVEFERTRQKN